MNDKELLQMSLELLEMVHSYDKSYELDEEINILRKRLGRPEILHKHSSYHKQSNY